jgi:hypothetical protein
MPTKEQEKQLRKDIQNTFLDIKKELIRLTLENEELKQINALLVNQNEKLVKLLNELKC